MTTTTTPTAFTTFVQPVPGLTMGGLMEAIVGDADLMADAPSFIGINSLGTIEFVTATALDGMAYAAMLVGAGVGVFGDTVYQRVGLGMLSAFAG